MACVVRQAQAQDCNALLAMIHGIAEHHQLRHQVPIGAPDLQADGFGPNPFYHCLLAELLPGPGEVPGPPNLYMEALYQGRGIGRTLLSEVAKVSLAHGCVEMKLMVMEGNHQAAAFYQGLGACDTTADEGWHCVELGGLALYRLAEEEP
ncbi:diamine acetyltransferase 2-like [Alligator mississippiensis]|uniref:Diamine acetyltransferase 2-like n=1 Tax=Alligator mississippiensis TaxID=8496 RepID=A0A151MW05_ALLMI|nr:diamine acetyltransferase 2-like [Alligator mississippiensis]